ncbi:DUF3667 domain-containing protein [Sunxiuqinia sp. sy24]|uniref:DUF3667 domain-containing protein n=1 Tax=Sunxiuqinia sp. sy24 TaxID=3461495 RepID=UPI0040457FD6
MRIKKWFKREKRSFDDLEEHACSNCSHEFKGFYCPNCGQSSSEFDRPVGFVFYDFLGNLLAFDSRFVRTFRDLVFKPGFLTVEFFKGRRARYAPPFRIYIFMSFILFLLLQIMSNRGLNVALEYSMSQQWNGVLASDSVVNASLDSLEVQLNLADNPESSMQLDYADLLQAGSLGKGLHRLANQLETKAEREDDPIKRGELFHLAQMFRSPDQLIAKFLKYLSYAFFILLPVFALLLSLVYFWQKIFYIRHLIFSVHLHAFIFFLLSLEVTAYLTLPDRMSAFSLWLLLLIPGYSYWALKKVYKQTYLKTLGKFLFLGFTYNIILMAAVVAVFINVLGGV